METIVTITRRRNYTIRLDASRLDPSDVRRCTRAAADRKRRKTSSSVAVLTIASAAAVSAASISAPSAVTSTSSAASSGVAPAQVSRNAPIPVRQRAVNMFVDALKSVGLEQQRASGDYQVTAAAIEAALYSYAASCTVQLVLPASPINEQRISETYRSRARELSSCLRHSDGHALRQSLLDGSFEPNEFVAATDARLAQFNPTQMASLRRAQKELALESVSRDSLVDRRRAEKGMYVCAICNHDECDIESDLGTHVEVTKAETWGSKDPEKNASWAFITCLRCGSQRRVET